MWIRRRAMTLVLTIVVLLGHSTAAALAGDHVATGASSVVAGSAAQAPGAAGQWVPSGLDGRAVTALAVDPRTPTTVYAGTDAGVYKSIDGGRTWNPGKGISPSFVLGLGIDPSNPATVFAGTGDAGIFKTTDSGANWTAVNTGLTELDIYSVTVDPHNSNIVYAGINGRDNGSLFKSTNGGATWTPLDGRVAGATRVAGLIVDPTDSNTIYAALDGAFMYKSIDAANSFQIIGQGLPGFCCSTPPVPAILTLIMHPTTPTTLYLGLGLGEVYKTTNGGLNWVPANSGLPPGSIGALAFHPNAPTTMYAAPQMLGADVFVTTDSGATWDPLADTPGDAYLIALATASGPRPALYAGTSNGVLRMDLESASPPSIDGIVRQISASGTYLPTDPRAPAGVYRITFGFRNTGAQAFTDLLARVTELTGGHTVVNRDGAPTSTPTGVGALVTVPDAALGPDGRLSPNETFSQVIEVGLQRREPFRIAFTGTGVPVESGATRSTASTRRGAVVLTSSGEFSPDVVGPSPTVTPPAGNPAGCAPRPKIDVRTATVGEGRLEATIATEVTAGVPDNALKAVRLTNVTNARVQVTGGPALSAGGVFATPPGAREVKLLLTREQPGPMMAHLEIEDGCGRHLTFAGAGVGIR